jgi:Methyltransferase domain
VAARTKYLLTSKTSRKARFLLQFFYMPQEQMISGVPKLVDGVEGYSEGFRDRVHRFGMRKLLDGSHFGGEFSDWKKQRRDGAVFISKPGTILDFGCANGFLLTCYQEWSSVDLEAFGVDSDEAAVNAARELFDDTAKDHFFSPSQDDFAKIPKRFDYAFWNVWDNAEFDESKNRMILDELLNRTKGGRTILGFYHPDSVVNARKLAWLSEHRYAITETKISENGHIFAAIDVPPDVSGAPSA